MRTFNMPKIRIIEVSTMDCSTTANRHTQYVASETDTKEFAGKTRKVIVETKRG